MPRPLEEHGARRRHPEDALQPHERLNPPPPPRLFPLEEDDVVLDESDQQLVDKLLDLRQDNKESHFVGVTGLSRRGGNTKNPRPTELIAGHIVVVRSDESERTHLPFFLGEVLEIHPAPTMDNDDNDGCNDSTRSKVTICEYGSTTLTKYTKTVRSADPPDPSSVPDVSKVRWQANFRGTEPGKPEQDEFHRDASCKPSKAVYTPLLLTIRMSAVAEFDEPDKMLNQGSNSRGGPKGRTLKRWVLKVLSGNDRINWQLDNTTTSRKRKRTDQL